MSNPNKPKGFELADSEGKAFRVRPYKKKTGNALYRGSVVKADSAGVVDLAGAGDEVLGIAMEYKAATSVDDILICDDPAAVYEAMAYGDFQQTSIFNNANIKVGSSDSSLFTSGDSIDMSTADTDASGVKQFHLVGLVVRGDNAFGSWARILVRPNYTRYSKGTVGI